MDKIYALVGIKGMPLAKDRSLFSVDKVIARDILSGDEDEFDLNEARDKVLHSNLEISGVDFLLMRNYTVIWYSPHRTMFIGHRKDRDDEDGEFEVGLIPIYYLDNPSKMPDYAYDSKNEKYNYVGDIDANTVKSEQILINAAVEHYDEAYFAYFDGSDYPPPNDYGTARIRFKISLTVGGGLKLCLKASINERDTIIDEFGKDISDSKYFINGYSVLMEQDDCISFKNSGLATLKLGEIEEVTELVAGALHIVNPLYMLKDSVIITNSSCKVLKIERCRDSGRECRDYSLVISPSIIKIISGNLDGESTLVSRNVKLYISREMNISTIIDFVKSIYFWVDKRRIIGFWDFKSYRNYSKESKELYDKCIEITDIIDSNDTSHRLFNDIEYLVEELNKIRFNIELY